MLERDAKLLFSSGALDGAFCTRSFFSNKDWVLSVVKLKTMGQRHGTSEVITLQRGDTERHFKTLDAVFKVAESIGFNKITIYSDVTQTPK